MTVTLIPEDELREALSPYRVDPDAFEAGVRARLTATATSEGASVQRLSPALQAAAAFLPLDLLSGGQLVGAAVKLAPATGVYKLLAYLAFPAISLFVLLGATVFGAAKIRGLKGTNVAAPADAESLQTITKKWWSSQKWGVWSLFAVSLVLAWFGLTWLLFLFYIVSLGMLIVVLSSLAKIGLGNRIIVGQSCALSLVFLGQMAGFPGIGDQDIHFVDQSVIPALFLCGAMVIALVVVVSMSRKEPHEITWSVHKAQFSACVVFVVVATPLIGWYLKPMLWPATPARIVAYVESFDKARFSTASWREWEIVASWTVEQQLNPNLARPRKLLATEIAGAQNPFILGNAFRVGLILPAQIDKLREYSKQRQSLLDNPHHIMESFPLYNLEQEDWVIRAAVLRNELTTEERDYLEKRLLVTLEDPKMTFTLKCPLIATQLLQVIGRPVDADRYRAKMHDLLRKFHTTRGGGFQPAGGFKEYDTDKLRVGSLDATSCAVGLMGVYGIPEGLDIDWVRSYLRPQALRFSPYNWIAAVTLNRLNALPGVTRPTWLQWLYYERSLLAAVVLVVLCVYATLASPMPKRAVAAATPA